MNTVNILLYMFMDEKPSIFLSLIESEPFALRELDDAGFSVLHRASSSYQEELVLHCLEKGVDVNGQDREGITPLMEGATSGCVEIVNHLLKFGADVNIMDVDGYTALWYALANENWEVFRILMNVGANGILYIRNNMMLKLPKNTDRNIDEIVDGLSTGTIVLLEVPLN